MAGPRSHPNPDALATAEAAVYLRISKAKLADLIAAKAVPSYKIGARRFFLRSALDEWVRDLTAQAVDLVPSENVN